MSALGLLTLVLTSYPEYIRRNMWKAWLAVLFLLILVPLLALVLVCLPKEPSAASGYLPLSRHWLRRFVKGALIFSLVLLGAMLFCSPAIVFALFPGLVR